MSRRDSKTFDTDGQVGECTSDGAVLLVLWVLIARLPHIGNAERASIIGLKAEVRRDSLE